MSKPDMSIDFDALTFDGEDLVVVETEKVAEAPKKRKKPAPVVAVEDTSSIFALDLDDEEIPAYADSAIMSAVAPVVEDAHPLDFGVSVPIPTSGIAGLITDIDDSVENLTWLIYGKNGTGKTTILSTVEGMLLLAAEDGTLSIKDKAKGAKKLRIDSFDKLEAVYWLLSSGKFLETGGIEIPTAGGKFVVKSIGFDTIDKLADVCMRQVVLGEKSKDLDKDILKRTLKNWGEMNEKMRYWLQKFKELPIQKVWLCQESSNSEDVESEEFTIAPAVNKGLRNYIQSEADVIARLFIHKDATGRAQFRMSALPNPIFITKDRTNKLTGVIPNPNLSKLYRLVFAE